jgi:small-conductance mechanosensitive channel
MTTIDTARSVISHRGMSCLELHAKLGRQARELRQLRPRAEQATAMEARIDEQAMTIGSLRKQLAAAKKVREDQYAKAARCDDADRRADEAERQLDEQMVELVALRQFKANVCSASDLPQAGPEAPAGDQFTTAGRVPPSWAREDDTVPVPVITPVEPKPAA